ncbi:MAG TPA: cytochrome P450, partial [Cyanothece sp. UBA12306]|nr:cytochrome P450 [Cyanothece sp. UBA12306]
MGSIKVDPLFIDLTMGVISYFLLGIAKKPDQTFTNPTFNPTKLYKALGILERQVLLEATSSNKIIKRLFARKLPDFDESWQEIQDFLNPQVALALTIARQPETEAAKQADPLVKQSILVQLAKSPKYTHESLLAESMAAIFAGHDTTAHTLSFMIGELGMNPQILAKAQMEVDQVWQATG